MTKKKKPLIVILNARFVKSIREARKQFKKGDVVSHAKVFKKV